MYYINMSDDLCQVVLLFFLIKKIKKQMVIVYGGGGIDLKFLCLIFN